MAQEQFEGRPCPRYALGPMRVLGMSQNTLVLALETWFLLHYIFGVGAGWAVLAVSVVGFAAEKLSQNREANFVMHWSSSRARNGLARFLGKAWRAQGALPAPNYQSHYEP